MHPSPFLEWLIGELRSREGSGLYFVERRPHQQVTKGKPGDFVEWQRRHGHGFRRYSTNVATWTNRDAQKFAILERAPEAFYVELNSQSPLMTVYPPRHLCT
jgi:hypothetical protein